MATTRSDTVPELTDHLLAGCFLLEEADILHPRHNDDDSQPEFLGLIQQGDRGNRVRQDGVDASHPTHEREVRCHLIGFGKLIPHRVWPERAVGHPFDKEFLSTHYQKLSVDFWPLYPGGRG